MTALRFCCGHVTLIMQNQSASGLQHRTDQLPHSFYVAKEGWSVTELWKELWRMKTGKKKKL
jgi:hypothetical protein